MQLGDTSVTHFSTEQPDWDYADYTASFGETSVGKFAHEPHTTAAVDQVQSLFG